ncbi:hypothetical protein [Magnetospirillum sulfuroxidans]|uniref:O-antigen polysaccharide polymerase Wzy n=1 Tax=Magnetospirillum sulfuroxidans TaxID=611300 RepID=A0ABS5IGY0_9PROT|nr:hypothetical protein [Magnetospirillum sulfuroxidans]MBR9973691.1 hypothetical protein [Magnetospirillum sulfuroxidans]
MNRPPDDRLSISPVHLWSAGIIGIGMILLVLLRPERLTLVGSIAAAASVGLCLAHVAAILLPREKYSLPFVEGIGLFYLIEFSIQPFLVDFIWPNAAPIRTYVGSPEIIEFNGAVMGALLLGVTSFFVSFHLIRGVIRQQRTLSTLVPDLPPATLVKLGWICVVSHVVWLSFPGVFQIPSLGQLIGPLGFLGFGIFFLLAVRRQTSRLQLLIVFGILLPWRIYLGIKTGALVGTLLLPAFLTFLLAAVNRRRFIIVAAAFAILTLSAYPIFVTYRAILVWETDTLTLADRLNILRRTLSDVASKEIMTQDGETVQTSASRNFRAVRQVLRRLNQSAILAVVYERSPEPVQYWNGETLSRLISSPLPRILWANKPLENLGNTFGHRYGFIVESDTKMSVNLPWLVEGFVNFGWWGLVAVMAGAGIFLGLLDGALNRLGAGVTQTVVAGTLLFPLINHESNISLTVGSTLPTLLILIVILYIAGRLSAPRSGRA